MTSKPLMSFKVFQLPTGMSHRTQPNPAPTNSTDFKQLCKLGDPLLYGLSSVFTQHVGDIISSNAEKQNTDPSIVFN